MMGKMQLFALLAAILLCGIVVADDTAEITLDMEKTQDTTLGKPLTGDIEDEVEDGYYEDEDDWLADTMTENDAKKETQSKCTNVLGDKMCLYMKSRGVCKGIAEKYMQEKCCAACNAAVPTYIPKSNGGSCRSPLYKTECRSIAAAEGKNIGYAKGGKLRPRGCYRLRKTNAIWFNGFTGKLAPDAACSANRICMCSNETNRPQPTKAPTKAPALTKCTNISGDTRCASWKGKGYCVTLEEWTQVRCCAACKEVKWYCAVTINKGVQVKTRHLDIARRSLGHGNADNRQAIIPMTGRTAGDPYRMDKSWGSIWGSGSMYWVDSKDILNFRRQCSDAGLPGPSKCMNIIEDSRCEDSKARGYCVKEPPGRKGFRKYMQKYCCAACKTVSDTQSKNLEAHTSGTCPAGNRLTEDECRKAEYSKLSNGQWFWAGAGYFSAYPIGCHYSGSGALLFNKGQQGTHCSSSYKCLCKRDASIKRPTKAPKKDPKKAPGSRDEPDMFDDENVLESN